MDNAPTQRPINTNILSNQDESLLIIKTIPKVPLTENPKKKNKYQLSARQQVMMKKAEQIINNAKESFWPQYFYKLAEFRQAHISELLKLLLFSYQQITSQVSIKKLLKQEYLISIQTTKLLIQTPNFQKTINRLKLLAFKIQKCIFNVRNTSGSNSKQGRKYQFHFKHLFMNMRSQNNEHLRQNITNGTYTPQYISCMDQLDMLQTRKRKYIQTKCTKYISDKENKRIRKQKKERQQLAFTILESQAKKQRIQADKQNTFQKEKIQSFHQFVKQLNMQYYLTRDLICNLQTQLSEIPFKSVRNRTLANLKQTFDKI